VKGRSWVTLAVIGAIGLVVGLSVGAVAWMGGDHNSGSGMSSHSGRASGTADNMGPGMTMGPMDEKLFLEQMVPHHESAVEMAQIALKKTNRPEVRTLAQGIVSSQEAEISQMKSLHQSAFGTALTRRPMAMGSMDMNALEVASGDKFDRMFLAMMIPHHASAVMMADAVKLGSAGPETTKLADTIISAQSKEIGQMQKWRETWYPPLG
jgi:uncharacterized protein (DUF305 family)